VVHEAGKTATDSIAFIRNCLYELMSDQEKEEFICTIVQELLTQPTKAFSQNAVLDALNAIGVPVKLYIQYMVEKLKPYVSKEAIPAGSPNPITMIVSVLAMALSSYGKLKDVDAVDVVASDEPMSHDHQYKALFYTVHWVCANPQSLFNKHERTCLLSLLTQCMCELSKVVSYAAVLEVMQDSAAV
jgi:hypothetical protein